VGAGSLATVSARTPNEQAANKEPAKSQRIFITTYGTPSALG